MDENNQKIETNVQLTEAEQQKLAEKKRLENTVQNIYNALYQGQIDGGVKFEYGGTNTYLTKVFEETDSKTGKTKLIAETVKEYYETTMGDLFDADLKNFTYVNEKNPTNAKLVREKNREELNELFKHLADEVNQDYLKGVAQMSPAELNQMKEYANEMELVLTESQQLQEEKNNDKLQKKKEYLSSLGQGAMVSFKHGAARGLIRGYDGGNVLFYYQEKGGKGVESAVSLEQFLENMDDVSEQQELQEEVKREQENEKKKEIARKQVEEAYAKQVEMEQVKQLMWNRDNGSEK